MKPWFERFPGRLEYELNELNRAGYEYALNDELKAEGRIVLSIEFPVEGESHKLMVRYPDLYPWLPFEIIGSTLPSGRHICPTTGVLCLMEQPHSKWSTTLTIKWALDNQVKALIQAHLDPAHAVEAQEGQQSSGYYRYTPDSIMLTSDWSLPPQYTHGRLVIGLEPGSNPTQAFRGAVIEVQDTTGQRIAALDERLTRRYTKKIQGRWVRLPAPPDGRAEGAGELADAIKYHGSLAQVKLDTGIDIVGLLFPEESAYGIPVENWLFTLRTKESIKTGKVSYPAALIRADSVDSTNFLARAPALAPLANKKVLLVGSGAIGSMIAWQLARAGLGALSLLDHDFVQIGNMPRWSLGFPAIGKSKVRALAENLTLHYPFISVDGAIYRLGTAQAFDETAGDFDILSKFTENIDLLIDATAEKCLSMALSEICQEKNIPYIWATGTPGSRGGVVGRVLPDKTKGCWKCFQHHMDDGTIITPVKEERPEIQPKGCFHPTFTGTGFDMDNVSLAATRLAVSTLCGGEIDAYPELDWDVAVLNMWNGNQSPILPEWTPYVLIHHPKCPDHG